METIVHHECTFRNLDVYLGKQTVTYTREIMEKPQTTRTIPWERVAHLLDRRDQNQPWLASQLGVSKQAVTNWRTRGSIPLDYTSRISALLNVPVEDLLASEDDAYSPNRDQNRPLSEVTKRLIFCAVKLDRSGKEAFQLLEHHVALLEFAWRAIPSDHSSYELNGDEIGRLLQAPEAGTKGANGR